MDYRTDNDNGRWLVSYNSVVYWGVAWRRGRMLFAEKSQISHTRGRGGGWGRGGILADRDKMIVSNVLFINKEVSWLFIRD